MKEVNLIESLHPLERAVLPVLKDGITLQEITKLSNLSEVEATRAIQWLENKKVLSIQTKVEDIVTLDDNGESYIREGLPEKRFLQALERPMTIKEIQDSTGLDKDEISISLGTLKKKDAISIGEKISLTPEGKKLLEVPWPEDKFLDSLPISKDVLSDEQKEICSSFQKRKKIILAEKQKTRTIILTDLGRDLTKISINDDYLGSITPSMLKTQSWKNKKFRRYDVSINVPKIHTAKRHFVNQAIEYIKKVWMDMGFKEMTGPMLDTCFWNFDALFVPQDHPAREMQDTFYINGTGKLPDARIVNNVRKAHESGTAGSIGWQYRWDAKKAQELVLRTHTTILSAKTIASLGKSNLPAKYFAVGKCFRNEAVDWSHLFEFNQVEGIVIDEDVTFRHLLGYLKQFYKKLGFEKARFRPAYFPYTEMSVEIEIFHPEHKKWLELGGAGIFRPEVVTPLLGKDVPVLAWGPGIDRMLMDYYRLTDLRDLYKNDIKQLKEMKVWMK